MPLHVKATTKSAVLRTFGVVERLPSGSGDAVLLTFDDGPHASVTDRVLDRLAAHGARAVFFIVGSRIASAPDVVHRIVAAGHVVGNHTYRHSLDRQPPLVAYFEDLKKCEAVLSAQVGRTPRLFRPALGKFTVGSLVAPKLLGLKTVYWSVDSLDWRLRDSRAARAAGERLSGTIRSGDIVLFHDDNQFVVEVLDIVLPALRQQGYDLQTGVRSLLGEHVTDSDCHAR